MSLRSPLGVVRGLGSAREGVRHWWLQRVTAIALVPLVAWFVWSVICVSGMDYADARAWLGAPHVTTLMLAFVAGVFWHAQLGLQVVLEDYVHQPPGKVAAQVAVRLAMALGALGAVVAVLKISLGTP